MQDPFRIVCIGDSIVWGQGLSEAEKFDAMVKAALTPRFPNGVTLEKTAHSGAVIGASGAVGNPAPGEVPESRLSIIEQCDGFTNSPETVDLVLMNGGINDVSVSNILNPFSLIPSLRSRVSGACRDGMLMLLNKVSARFTKPSCRILVIGYYIILSDQSDPFGIGRMLGLHGLSAPDFVAEAVFHGLVANRCVEFFNLSNADLQQAVNDTHDARISFVPSGFTAANAAFVPGTTFLFGLDDDLNPEDPVAGLRRPQCDAAFSPLQIAEREKCYRASAGHPNSAGAIQYKNQILAAI